MLAGVRGRLIGETFARATLPTMSGVTALPETANRALAAWSARRHAALGPASAVRAIAEVAVIPLLKVLDLFVVTRVDDQERCYLATAWRGSPSVVVLVVGWNESLDRAWRPIVLEGIVADRRWCLCCNGRSLRIVDAQHTWTRRFLEFDLDLLAEEGDSSALLWALLRGEALAATPSVLDRAVELSARQGVAVCRALGDGVVDALGLLLTALPAHRRRGHSVQSLFEQALTVLYRVLFLLFAEARGLVPVWHQIYRDSYSIAGIVTTLLAGRRYAGLWKAIQAISRLAHAGCSAGELNVTAFNGRLFSPSQSVLFDRGKISDGVIGRAILAVSTVATPEKGCGRIAYGDLDVEQLGAVYEHVLDYQPTGDGPQLDRSREGRKSSGTFYTPRAVTAHLVRRTLEPLVRNRSAEDILRLRIVDPAMGSGAFLVEACRYISAAVEDALIREGRWHSGDILPIERAMIRREVAQRCLYGVDSNPMAVQLARLSLWLATLAAEKPLTFLDHRLLAGDSLVGAAPDDVRRQPSRTRRRVKRHSTLPLFVGELLIPVLENAVRTRLRLALEPDDSVTIVREKERTLSQLVSRDGSLGRWSRLLDLWCAGWFWDQGTPPDGAAFAELGQLLLQGASALSSRIIEPMLERSEAIAERLRFFHWPLAFPEIFVDESGAPLVHGGFDAVIGNPPWDMIRGDSGDDALKLTRRRDAQHLTGFVREAGIYRVESRSHSNRYQLFVERALQLVRHGGRIGFVLPSGMATDAGAAPLRCHLFNRASIDCIIGLDNRGGIFPIHRGLRFVLLTCTSGSPTVKFECRFGIDKVDDLERSAGAGDPPAPLLMTRQLLERIAGADDLGIPELCTEMDLRIVEKISASVPWLGSENGWNVRFGRELNASDDRRAFANFSGNPGARPVLEGKHIEPFRAFLNRCQQEVPPDSARRIRVPKQARLAYRDIASPTNRLTLIAAIVPARAVTTHTLFCLKTPLSGSAQFVLCALLNSFPANYLVRLRVNTHVTAALMRRLPVPFVPPQTQEFARLESLSRALIAAPHAVEHMEEYVELQAMTASLYGLDDNQLEHVLSTFPLIANDVKTRVLAGFRTLCSARRL